MRKDGRPLVTEHPVTAMDWIDVIPRGELEIPESAIACKLMREPQPDWMQDF